MTNQSFQKRSIYDSFLGMRVLRESLKHSLAYFWYFLRYIRAKFSIPTLPYSPDVGENTEERISDFRISGQSLVKENYHNSRTSDIDNQYIDTKLGSVTKLAKRDKKCHCHFPNLWLIWSNPEAGFWTHSPQNLHFH